LDFLNCSTPQKAAGPASSSAGLIVKTGVSLTAKKTAVKKK